MCGGRTLNATQKRAMQSEKVTRIKRIQNAEALHLVEQPTEETGRRLPQGVPQRLDARVVNGWAQKD